MCTILAILFDDIIFFLYYVSLLIILVRGVQCDSDIRTSIETLWNNNENIVNYITVFHLITAPYLSERGHRKYQLFEFTLLRQ